MKKWILLVVLAYSAVAFSQSDDLVRLADRVERVVRDRGYRLNDRERAQVQNHLMSVLRIFRDNPGPPPPPPPAPDLGYYCSAACRDSNGGADLRYTRGASARFEAEARQLARETLTRSFTCNRGIIDLDCSPVSFREKHYSIATCADANANPDLRQFGLAEAASYEESRQLAREALTRKYTCNRGAIMWGSDTDRDGTFYCIVGCMDANGGLDHRYTSGASGASAIQATGLAAEELNRKFTCNRGVKVDTCSR